MKRKPRETKKERRAREAREAAKPKPVFKSPVRTLELSETSYVEEIIKPDTARVLAAGELLKDPRVQIWFEQLNHRVNAIIQGSPVSRREANDVLEQIDKWEHEHAGKFKSKNDAVIKIARLLDHIIATRPKRPGPVVPAVVQAEAEVYAQIVDAVQDVKVNFLRTAERIMLPEGQAAVATYHHCLNQLSTGAKGIVKDVQDVAGGIQLARRLWAEISNARVFEIPLEIWTHLYRAHEQGFTKIASEKGITDEEALAHVVLMGSKRPFPEKLPFDHTYIGFGAGIPLSADLTRMRVRDATVEDSVLGSFLLGYFVSGPLQQAYEILHIITKEKDYFMPSAQRADGIWAGGWTLAPWLVGDMIDLINEHNTVVLNHEPTPKMRDDARKQKLSALGYIPQPYYTVRLKHKLIDEDDRDRTSETGVTHVLSYRHDRRGHVRCYVERGPLPIDPKKEAKLLKYGYRFIAGEPNAEDAAHLAKRNFPPKSNKEWMAIKVRWIADMVVGDPKLPYVPAVRVPEKLEASP